MEEKMKRKRLVRTLIVCVLAAISLLGCAASGGRAEEIFEDRGQALMAAPEPAPAREGAVSSVDYLEEAAEADVSVQAALAGGGVVDRKIIYTVNLDLVVEDTEVAFQEIQRLTEGMGGFVSQSNMWRQEDHPRGSLTVRVPAESLDEALAQFRALAVDVESQSRDSQDVTEEYVDLQARLENEQRTERELQELLESRSERGKTDDILQVHRELSQVRSQIEQIQGRMTYLDNLSSMATVHISLTPDVLAQPVVVAGWQPKGTALRAIKMLVNALQGIADAAIMFFLLVLPILLVIAVPLVVLFLLLRFVVRRMRRRRARAKASSVAPAKESEG
jgi:hypothetical protein